MIRYAFPTAFCALLMPLGAQAHPDTAHFAQSAFVDPPKIVDCTLEDGSAAQCYDMTVPHVPQDLEIGPFCPETTTDAGGLWYLTGDQAGLYRIDGAFLSFLEAQGYRFFNDDGTVNSVTTLSSRPEADHTCIHVSPDPDVTMRVLLPVTPRMAETPTDLGTVAQVGIALDGAPIFADAPQIQQTGHMPALDLCGGHVDPGGWYHWHATATDVQASIDAQGVEATCTLAQDPSAQFGYAFDGYALFGRLESDGSTPTDLDSCNGHLGAVEGSDAPVYHYHATNSFPNLPNCLMGLTAQGNFSTTAS
ncbi:MAG: YHYH protein, partial [Pseudomonadota bacterium]